MTDAVSEKVPERVFLPREKKIENAKSTPQAPLVEALEKEEDKADAKGDNKTAETLDHLKGLIADEVADVQAARKGNPPQPKRVKANLEGQKKDIEELLQPEAAKQLDSPTKELLGKQKAHVEKRLKNPTNPETTDKAPSVGSDFDFAEPSKPGARAPARNVPPPDTEGKASAAGAGAAEPYWPMRCKSCGRSR